MVRINNLKKRVQYASSIDKELKDKLQQLSEQTRIPQSKLLDEAIEDLLRKFKFGEEHTQHQGISFSKLEEMQKEEQK